jgi:hypothetical protein
MVNAPGYLPDKLLHTDLQMPTIRKESRSLVQTIEQNYSRISITLRPTYSLYKARDV